MTVRWTRVTIDCGDANSVARFYAELLGWPVTTRSGDDWIQLRDPAGGVGLNIQAERWYRPPAWPEAPADQHKMMHFEIEVDDLDAALVTAVAAGGVIAPDQPADRDPGRIRVVLDPAGHPLCLFTAGE